MTVTAVAAPSPIEEILEAIDQLSVMELVALLRGFEKRFGVSATAPQVIPLVQQFPSVIEPVEEQTEFDLVLVSFGDNKKINVIKEVRAITGLGLKEAKDLVDRVGAGTPQDVLSQAQREEVDRAKGLLESAGAGVKVR